ncbi:hypothetical protein [Hoylesella marshii]|uniref:hypothetical protein n=1 Tax=Hoylesella marshii TaxID=189722 RepID=UPI0028D25291|nr:hypothetical protein [Hoylesella marshii]
MQTTIMKHGCKDNNKIKKKINDGRIFLTSVLHNQGQNKNFSACIAYANDKTKKLVLAVQLQAFEKRKRQATGCRF